MSSRNSARWPRRRWRSSTRSSSGAPTHSAVVRPSSRLFSGTSSSWRAWDRSARSCCGTASPRSRSSRAPAAPSAPRSASASAERGAWSERESSAAAWAGAAAGPPRRGRTSTTPPAGSWRLPAFLTSSCFPRVGRRTSAKSARPTGVWRCACIRTRPPPRAATRPPRPSMPPSPAWRAPGRSSRPCLRKTARPAGCSAASCAGTCTHEPVPRAFWACRTAARRRRPSAHSGGWWRTWPGCRAWRPSTSGPWRPVARRPRPSGARARRRRSHVRRRSCGRACPRAAPSACATFAIRGRWCSCSPRVPRCGYPQAWGAAWACCAALPRRWTSPAWPGAQRRASPGGRAPRRCAGVSRPAPRPRHLARQAARSA
mmetsp:Transcript_58436/g.181225  ORF Transcript_58436/g.181225 Transcript_58436/m.181225 type:complete len:372 (-) Transcript_58436:438-1553(-)